MVTNPPGPSLAPTSAQASLGSYLFKILDGNGLRTRHRMCRDAAAAPAMAHGRASADLRGALAVALALAARQQAWRRQQRAAKPPHPDAAAPVAAVLRVSAPWAPGASILCIGYRCQPCMACAARHAADERSLCTVYRVSLRLSRKLNLPRPTT